MIMIIFLQLQDLPNELLEDIIVQAVVMEVKAMKLAKSVWKEKADLVIRRLRTVCWQWRDILMTNYLRKKVHGILDNTGQFLIIMLFIGDILFKDILTRTFFLGTFLQRSCGSAIQRAAQPRPQSGYRISEMM